MRRKCRIWWPKQLTSTEPPSFSLFFGWFVSCSSSNSLNIVVALACNEQYELSQSGLEEILNGTNGNMPVFLQEKTMFSCLGLCAGYLSSNGVGSGLNRQVTFRENYGRWRCGCCKFDGLLEQCRQSSLESSYWVQMIYDSHEHYGRNIHWIPKLHHIHWNGEVVSQCDVHVIVYDTPTYGRHHYSLSFWDSSEQVKTSLKKPKWIDGLHQKRPITDLDTVILAINSASRDI